MPLVFRPDLFVRGAKKVLILHCRWLNGRMVVKPSSFTNIRFPWSLKIRRLGRVIYFEWDSTQPCGRSRYSGNRRNQIQDSPSLCAWWIPEYMLLEMSRKRITPVAIKAGRTLSERVYSMESECQNGLYKTSRPFGLFSALLWSCWLNLWRSPANLWEKRISKFILICFHTLLLPNTASSNPSMRPEEASGSWSWLRSDEMIRDLQLHKMGADFRTQPSPFTQPIRFVTSRENKLEVPAFSLFI